MRITVQGHTTLQGLNQIARAGRFFPIAEAREIEVLDQEDDPPEIEAPAVNATTGQKEIRRFADPDRMGRKSFRAILKDKRFTVRELGAVNSAAADAQVQAARRQVERLAGQISDLEVENASLRTEIEQLRAELAAANDDGSGAGEDDQDDGAGAREAPPAVGGQTAVDGEGQPPAGQPKTLEEAKALEARGGSPTSVTWPPKANPDADKGHAKTTSEKGGKPKR